MPIENTVNESSASTLVENELAEKSGTDRPVDKQDLNICSIIIPVFNRLQLTKQCLDAIIANTPQNLYEVIVVDNASTDGTKNYLSSLNDAFIKIITNKMNLGFAKACNQGAQAASTEYILFLNNDTEPQKGWLQPLIDILVNDSTVAAAGSKLLFPRRNDPACRRHGQR